MENPRLDHRVCTVCHVSKSHAEFYRQKLGKDGRRADCIECDVKRRHANKAKKSEYDRQYRAANADRIIAYREANPYKHDPVKSKSKALANAEKLRIWRKAYYLKTKAKRDLIRDVLAARAAEYARKNPHSVNARNAARRARKIQATPTWADKTAIKTIYALASELSATGVLYAVDHIVPLRSELVCGLHCEANLQVIPFKENCRKSNVWWPNMP